MLQDARDPNNTALIELFFFFGFLSKNGGTQIGPHSVDKLGQNFDTFLNRV